MKKIITFSTVCLLLLLSCNKNERGSFEEEQYYDVTFKVSAYATSIRPMSGVDGFGFEDVGVVNAEYVVVNLTTDETVYKQSYPVTSEENSIPSSIIFRLTKGSYRIIAVAQCAPIYYN